MAIQRVFGRCRSIQITGCFAACSALTVHLSLMGDRPGTTVKRKRQSLGLNLSFPTNPRLSVTVCNPDKLTFLPLFPQLRNAHSRGCLREDEDQQTQLSKALKDASTGQGLSELIPVGGVNGKMKLQKKL